ncbi:TNF receptor-associated factor 1-like [Oopsacas minuta]|uniref:TNF receptor-associated factor 1-like n=1 Tax=Oopsacas minuta TaxID=111878 RepID=A0AAV7JDL0_9METZ|nr:TNF receptor-associated factor 1-like [Oopsacas minuta]
MAEKLTDSEGREDLVYIKTEDGSYRGWRVDLLIDKLSSKMEEKILLCSSCKGMLRDACIYEGDLRCGQLEWKIKGVKQKIENKEDTYSDPFYVGLYKCQGYIQWNRMNTFEVGVFIFIMKGDYDDKLHWPIRYKYTFILLNHINSNNNYEITSQITKKHLENNPNSFKRPTELRNKGSGTVFISNTEILEAKYCKEDSITLLIIIELLPAL